METQNIERKTTQTQKHTEREKERKINKDTHIIYKEINK
jgi:hypothetical protein